MGNLVKDQDSKIGKAD